MKLRKERVPLLTHAGLELPLSLHVLQHILLSHSLFRDNLARWVERGGRVRRRVGLGFAFIA